MKTVLSATLGDRSSFFLVGFKDMVCLNKNHAAVRCMAYGQPSPDT